jgi:hypothetical protein
MVTAPRDGKGGLRGWLPQNYDLSDRSFTIAASASNGWSSAARPFAERELDQRRQIVQPELLHHPAAIGFYFSLRAGQVIQRRACATGLTVRIDAVDRDALAEVAPVWGSVAWHEAHRHGRAPFRARGRAVRAAASGRGGCRGWRCARRQLRRQSSDARCARSESRQPELKHAAVRIEPARLAWHYCVFGRVGATRWLRLQRSLRAHFPAFDYCACVPLWCGDDEDGALLLRAASLRSADPSRLQAIEMEFGLAEPDTLRYDDSRRSLRRRLRIRFAADGSALAAHGR